MNLRQRAIQETVRVMLLEHGSHDQKSHGRRGGGGGGLLPAPMGFEGLSAKQRAAAIAQAKELGEPTIDQMVANMNAYLDSAIEVLGKKGTQEAKDWYPEARRQAKSVADSTGIPLEAVVAATSVTSPKTEWGANQRIVEGLARKIVQKKPITVTEKQSAKLKSQLGLDIPAGTQFDARKLATENPDAFVRVAGAPCPGAGWNKSAKAVQVMTGQLRPSDVIKGPKTQSFYNNILDPGDTRFATIDRHAYRTNSGKPTAGEAEMRVLDRRRANTYTVYSMHVEATRRAAEAHGLTPNAAQAVSWVMQKRLHGKGAQARATRKRNR